MNVCEYIEIIVRRIRLFFRRLICRVVGHVIEPAPSWFSNVDYHCARCRAVFIKKKENGMTIKLTCDKCNKNVRDIVRHSYQECDFDPEKDFGAIEDTRIGEVKFYDICLECLAELTREIEAVVANYIECDNKIIRWEEICDKSD